VFIRPHVIRRPMFIQKPMFIQTRLRRELPLRPSFLGGLAAALIGAGCSLSPSLGVPHEDPEPIGSAPWESGDSELTDPGSKPDSDAQARTAARNRARRGKHESHASDSPAPGPSASSTPSAAPTAKADADGDGVEDARDACPRSPGADDPNPAYAGCPYDAPPRPTRPIEDLDLAFGDAPRALDAKETEAVQSVAGVMKGEPSITLSTYARKKTQGEGWLKIVKTAIVQGGFDPAHVVTQVCLQTTGLTHTVVSRGAKSCEGP